jgi:hypothetical protein
MGRESGRGCRSVIVDVDVGVVLVVDGDVDR